MATAKTEKTADDRRNEQILSRLRELGGKTFDVSDKIVFEGNRLVLPVGTTIDQNIAFLNQRKKEDEQQAGFQKTFPYRPWDGAWCMYNAFKKLHGAVTHKGTMGFFGANPPSMITIPSGVGETLQVPWGVFALPFLPGVQFECDQSNDAERGPLFAVSAYGPKKYGGEIEGLFKAIEMELRTNSLYRGKAFDGQEMPEFVDVFEIDAGQVVYSEQVLADLGANVWAQLRHTAEFERLGIPLKRAVLLHGPFGTGKTLAALLTGQVATRNGWTFIKARSGRDNLSYVLQTARLYDPCVVFYEDVDQLMDPDTMDRDEITRLLDDFDGMGSKGTKILCVLTTNYPEKIQQGMARPGRIDAFIEINELDQEGVRKLIETRIADQLADDVDWEQVYEAAKGYKPAFVTEAATRSIRYVINEHGGVDGQKVSTAELVHSAQNLRDQFNRHEGAKHESTVVPLEAATKRMISEVLQEQIREDLLVEND